MNRTALRVLATAGLAVSTGAVLVAGTAAPASAVCIPSYSGYGPTVYVDVDYNQPTNSEVYYDSSDFSIKLHLCVI